MKATQAWTGVFQDRRTFSPDGGLGNYDPFGFFATMPGIGYTREKQEEYAKLYRLWHGFEAGNEEIQRVDGHRCIDATQKFHEYVVAPPQDAPPLTSLKGIYGKWVDICEDVYAKHAMTKEYTTLYGETVNALMAFKKQFNKLADDVMNDLNLPTRKEGRRPARAHARVAERQHRAEEAVATLMKGKGGRAAKRSSAPKAKKVKVVKKPAPKAVKASAPKAPRRKRHRRLLKPESGVTRKDLERQEIIHVVHSIET